MTTLGIWQGCRKDQGRDEMTTENPASGNATALLAHISDCQHDAVMLHGLCQAVDFLIDNASMEPSPQSNALTPLIALVVRQASDLANKLDSTVAQRATRGRA